MMTFCVTRHCELHNATDNCNNSQYIRALQMLRQLTALQPMAVTAYYSGRISLARRLERMSCCHISVRLLDLTSFFIIVCMTSRCRPGSTALLIPIFCSKISILPRSSCQIHRMSLPTSPSTSTPSLESSVPSTTSYVAHRLLPMGSVGSESSQTTLWPSSAPTPSTTPSSAMRSSAAGRQCRQTVRH